MITQVAINQDGYTYALPEPYRHSDLIKVICQMTSIKRVTGVQGFIDENRNFYTREEAAKHAIFCNQITELK